MYTIDDPGICLSILLIPNFALNTFFSFLCIGVDLALLSLANHSIISYGTFAMWGAFLSNKGEVVMPKDHINTDVGQRIKMANISNWKFL